MRVFIYGDDVVSKAANGGYREDVWVKRNDFARGLGRGGGRCGGGRVLVFTSRAGGTYSSN